MLGAAHSLGGPPRIENPDRTRLVVVLYPEAADGSPGNALADRGIRAAFAEFQHFHVEIHNEYLDVSRFPDADYQRDLLQLLERKYQGRQVDLVIVGLASALEFAVNHHNELFPDAPKIFFSVDRQEVQKQTLPADVIGVPITMDLRESLELALRLHPGTEHVFVVAGKSKLDAYWEQAARTRFGELGPRPTLEYLSGLPLKDLLNRAADLPEHSIVYYLHVFEDGDGKVNMPAEVLSRLSAVANAPIYGHVDSYVGRGIVGGKVFSFEQEGKRAAELALRVLGGEAPRKLGIQKTSENSYVFDARQLSKWDIDESRLPVGSTVRFQEASFWADYKWHVFAAAAVCGFQGLLIARMIVQRNRRTRAERISREELQELNRRLLMAQENERKRIARELHDDIGQTLALLSVEMDLLHQESDKSKGQLGPRLDAMSARVKQLSTAIHELSHQLHPIKLEQLGLITALSSVCSELSRIHAVPITFSHNGLPAISPEIALCVYRITQEALSNAIRHSGAKSINVIVKSAGTGLSVEIIDDGRGFDPSAVANKEGLGLVSIRERIRAADGSLDIDTKPGQGTRMKIVLPLTNAAPNC
jgi:signal transduction histidine kinase